MRHYSDEEDYSAQLNDKSTEIWAEAAKKRQKVMQSLTPSYSRSRPTDNHMSQSISGVMDKKLDNIKEKINHQKSASKQKDYEIENLKDKISQLTKDKKILLSQIEFIHSQAQQNEPGRENTINFEKTHTNEVLRASKNSKGNKYQLAESISDTCREKLEDLPKAKLLELLRSTSQYRSFANYHDSHELIFLSQLHSSSKRNYKHQPEKKEEWTDLQILNEFAKLNEKENLGLNYHNQNLILSRMKDYYERQFEERARNLRSEHEGKLKKTIRETSIIPQDLKEICKIKEGQLAQQMARKKGKSLKKKQQP